MSLEISNISERSNIIELKNLRLRPEIGVFDNEQGIKQEVIINIQLRCKIPNDLESDDIEDFVDYSVIYEKITGFVRIGKFYTIEKLSGDIARICLLNLKVLAVKVCVQKPHILRFLESSALTLERYPEDFNDSVVYLSLSSNNDSWKNITRAVELLRKKVTILQHSSVFTTIDFTDSKNPSYLNMAIEILTGMCPQKLKEETNNIEKSLFRIKGVSNSIIPIDIDISIWQGIESLDEFNAQTKRYINEKAFFHPDVTKLAHVIVPLVELIPNYKYPVKNGITLSQIAVKVTGKEDYLNTFPSIPFMIRSENQK